MQRKVLALLLTVSFLSAARTLAGPTDLWVWREASDARISPDATLVVYVEKWSDRQKEAAFANLWLVSSDGRRRNALTQGDWSDRSPRWSADSARIAWISERNGRTQIWTQSLGSSRNEAKAAPLDTGDAQPLSFAWSPDGKWIAFTAAVPSPAAPPTWAPLAIVPLIEPRPGSIGQIFVVPAAGGTLRKLSGAKLDFIGEPAWMPNGQSLLCAERSGEIFALRLADGVARQLTHESAGATINRDPLPSPDGSRIAYTAAAAGPQYYAVRQLRVMNADGSRDRQLAGNLGRDVLHPQWSNDSRTIYFIADDRGATHVYAARNDGSVHQLTDRSERLHGFSLAENGRAVTVRSSATEASAVFTFATDVPAGGWTLIDVNQQLMAERDWGAVEQLTLQAGGKSVQAWLTKPPRFDAARKYPLLLDIQDPSEMRGSGFDVRAQTLAAGGFVVLQVNPRGTRGYGEEFGNLLDTQIPGDPASDLQAAVERAIATGYIDPRRVVVVGGSMAVWLLSHAGRFAAGVTHRLTQARMLPQLFSGEIQAPVLVVTDSHDPASELLFSRLRARHADSALLRLPANAAAVVLELQSTLAWLSR